MVPSRRTRSTTPPSSPSPTDLSGPPPARGVPPRSWRRRVAPSQPAAAGCVAAEVRLRLGAGRLDRRPTPWENRESGSSAARQRVPRRFPSRVRRSERWGRPGVGAQRAATPTRSQPRTEEDLTDRGFVHERPAVSPRARRSRGLHAHEQRRLRAAELPTTRKLPSLFRFDRFEIRSAAAHRR